MKTEDIGTKSLSHWIPEQNIGTLALLGKSSEEINELGAIVARCTIQGVNGINPDTGEPNLDALSDEIADVNALTSLLIKRLGLNAEKIWERQAKKMVYKSTWIDELDRRFNSDTTIRRS